MSATTLNLASTLAQQARALPDRVAIVCGAQGTTYAQLHALACRVAGGLRGLGIQPGDRVALSCPNLTQFPAVYYGALIAGAILVPLNVLLKPREIAYHLADSEAAAFVVFEGTPELPMAQMARAAVDQVPACRHLVVITVDPAAPSPVDRAITLGRLMDGHAADCERHAAAPDDTAVLLYTSGTTGQPKGAELTHLNMALNALVSRDMMAPVLRPGLERPVVALVTLPLFHSTGQTTLMNAGLSGGFTLVLHPRFDPAATLRAFEEAGVNLWIGVPTMYWSLLHCARERGLDVSRTAATLQLCISGGAPMPVALMREFEAAFGVRVLEGYGLSETSPVVCFNHVFRPSKPGTVGPAVSGCEVRVVDADDRPLPPGEAGEVVVRGPNVMKGYYRRPEETAVALRGGWFHTGDVGTLDEDGYLTIVDRRNDMVLRGGLNVYPREIEDVLMTHPSVSLAAVIGVPDERLGEEVKAFVVLKAGTTLSAEALIAWSREQLAAYKYPRYVEFRDTLPVGPTGKVVKRALKGA